jgi:hypothetical protein
VDAPTNVDSLSNNSGPSVESSFTNYQVQKGRLAYWSNYPAKFYKNDYPPAGTDNTAGWGIIWEPPVGQSGYIVQQMTLQTVVTWNGVTTSSSKKTYYELWTATVVNGKSVVWSGYADPPSKFFGFGEPERSGPAPDFDDWDDSWSLQQIQPPNQGIVCPVLGLSIWTMVATWHGVAKFMPFQGYDWSKYQRWPPGCARPNSGRIFCQIKGVSILGC